uniref:Ion channel n=1 Tax=Candidatus Kentrum eta TaxID=2126337 RepID=A0A450UGY1_9GAMM|nr:MAG: Ion channel [Candidatus Kentron sp. H]VFJ91785.1 MAG: Ion channel [Candidatus Kentron sp. H]VFJ98416.1 MAG: Ion channel [Candidatus Kentron sp. H]
MNGSSSDREKNVQSRLLDSLYFAYYTITTTGYGDIAPGSDAIKFFTTVLNVIELLFIVIFINVLTSNRREKS